MRFLLRILINAAALWAATRLVDGISFTGDWRLLFVVALVFGIVNVIVRPVVFILSLPFVILSLGLFLFVINGLMLWLTGTVSDGLDLGFHVAGFWAAFWGALVVTVVSFSLSLLVGSSRVEVKRTRGEAFRRGRA